MEVMLRVAAAVVGAVIVQAVLRSAIRTVVVPRGEATQLTRWTYLLTRFVYELLSKRRRTYEERERIFARYAPTSLILLAVAWALGTMFGFTLLFWAAGEHDFADSMNLSGSSITTLGFFPPIGQIEDFLAVTEGLIGLGLVALLIGFLPTIYGIFSRREAVVLKLDVRAGSPPTALTMLSRFHQIGWLESIHEEWEGWEDWFSELEESHTSHPSLVFFRSQRPYSSWITSAGCVLDAAAITLSSIDLRPQPEAAVIIRSGSMALRSICAFFTVPIEANPEPNAPISIYRQEFDLLLNELAAQGLAIKADRDQCWRDFAGWRVNYDEPLLALCALVEAPPTPWSSDRLERFHPPTILHRTWRVDPPANAPSF